jgi:PPM family protein phosphatase
MSDDTRPIGPRESHLSDAPTGQIRATRVLSIEAAGRTDKGRVRPGNEDAWGLESPISPQARAQGTLLIVSDGMGGHAAGEVASNLAVETIKATYYRESRGSTADAVENAIAKANAAIFENAEQDHTRAGMGCTIVVMVIQGSSLTVGHVGDSRGYLIRSGQARQITRDHSWVAMQVEEGVLTPEQAEHHPNRSLLMRALGRQPSVEVEIGQHQLQSGDVLLLCSDGLTGVVNDAEIGEYASRYAPQAAADQLVNLANSRGAPDNVTVVTAAMSAAPAGMTTSNSSTTTIVAPPPDSPTPRMVTPLPGTVASGDTIRTTTDPDRTPADTIRTPIDTLRTPAGTPIVVSRASQPAAVGPIIRRRGIRGRWLAGSLAALGIASGLVLLTFLGPRAAGDPDPTRVTEAPAASKPAATPQASSGQAAPAATVPPPVATGIPGMTAPGSTVPAAPPSNAPQQPSATPPPAATSASKPSLETPAAAAAGIAATITTGAAPFLPPGISIGATPTPQAASSPSALSTPTATPTSAPRGASDAPPAASADPSNPESAGNPPGDEATGTEPQEGAPEMTDGQPAEEPGDGEGVAAQPEPEEPVGEQPGPALRARPSSSGILIPGGFGVPARKPKDD